MRVAREAAECVTADARSGTWCTFTAAEAKRHCHQQHMYAQQCVQHRQRHVHGHVLEASDAQ